MGGFFSVDGKFFSVTSKIVDMAVITLMWAVGCIPVVTILTSTSSLYHTTVKCIRYDRGKVYVEFIDAYKKNLKQGIPLTILYGFIGAVIGRLDYEVFILSRSRTSMVFIFAVGMLVLTVLYLLNVLWLVPVFSRFSNTFSKILQLNYVIAGRYFVRSIPMFAVSVTAVVFMLASPPLVILFPSLVMLINSYLAEPGLHKFMPVPEEDNGDWRYGFK